MSWDENNSTSVDDDFKWRAAAAERDRCFNRDWLDRTERLIQSAYQVARGERRHLDVDPPADWQLEALARKGEWRPTKPVRKQPARLWPESGGGSSPESIQFRPRHLREGSDV